MNSCKCGCGDKAKPGNSFIHGHNGTGKIRSTSSRRGMSITKLGHGVSESTRNKMSLASLRRWSDPSYQDKMVMSHLGNKNCLGYIHTWSTRVHMSIAQLGNQNALGSPGKLGQMNSEATRRKIRESWTPERRKWWSNHMKELWSDPDWKDSTIRASGLGSNNVMTRPEERLLNIIEDWGFKWKYNGNGSIIIGGCRPDFVPTNGFKGVIEHFGDYWHIDECELDKIKVYAQEGYSCLVF